MSQGVVIDRVVVVTDSVSCLHAGLIEKYDIRIVPVSIIINGRSYRDGLDITPKKSMSWWLMAGNCPLPPCRPRGIS